MPCASVSLNATRVPALKPKGSTTLATSGRLAAGTFKRVVFLPRKLAAGKYKLTISLVQPVNPDTPLLRESKPFAIAPPR